MKIKKKLSIKICLFKSLNDQKKIFCCSDQSYNISSKFFYFFRRIWLCVFFKVRKVSNILLYRIPYI